MNSDLKARVRNAQQNPAAAQALLGEIQGVARRALGWPQPTEKKAASVPRASAPLPSPQPAPSGGLEAAMDRLISRTGLVAPGRSGTDRTPPARVAPASRPAADLFEW